MNDCITEGSGAKVVDRFLLLTVDPSCDYGYVELPWLKDETHDRTELVKCVVTTFTMGCPLRRFNQTRPLQPAPCCEFAGYPFCMALAGRQCE